MKKSRLVSLFLILVILIVNVVPVVAAGGSVKLSVDNKTGAATNLTLSGPQRYSFSVKSGKNSFDILPGTYSYSFNGCGHYNYGTINAVKNANKLTLECSSTAGAGLATLKVNNKTGEELTAVLSGANVYYLNIKKGNNTFQVKPGKYAYSASACGEKITGNISISAKGGKFTLPQCKTTKSSSSQGLRLKFVNDTGGTIYVYLSGPENYSFAVNPGNSTFQVVSGTYGYNVITGCGNASGTLKMNKPVKWSWWCY